MTLQDIATALVDGCRTGTETANLDRLYASNAVSVEPLDHGNGREAHGLGAIHAKHDWWDANFDTHATTVQGPFLHGDDRFGVIFSADASDRQTGQRMQFTELAIYHVTDGLITREEFFAMG